MILGIDREGEEQEEDIDVIPGMSILEKLMWLTPLQGPRHHCLTRMEVMWM